MRTMCFSAESSFTVGSILSIMGIATFKQVFRWSRALVAIIPLLFGAQQIMEGIIWTHMDPEFISTPFSNIIVQLYLFFAWILWPLYIPIAFYLTEKIAWKRYACIFSLLIGIVVTFFDAKFLLTNKVTPTIVGNSLYYGFTPMHGNILYGIPAMLPIFISSIPKMWVFGIWLLITFIISQIIYTYTFTSVWCFFCAAVSILLFSILRKESYTNDLDLTKF